jgi:tRNA(Ile)-lysidine synthase
MSFSPNVLRAVLQAELPGEATGLVVALSGGADSGALLAALAALARAGELGLPLRAVHVDHGLQHAAAAFRAGCERLAQTLQVPLTILNAPASCPAGVSVEAAARDARYAAFAAVLEPGECLVTAHHADDQAETFLLQAVRGAGLKGLASMPVLRSFGSGWHLRPLLQVRRAELRAFAAAGGIVAVADPMNEDPRFDRNYLRAALWPQIESRWPGAAQSLTRAAAHVAEGQELLDALADADLALVRDGDALSLPRLRALGQARRVNVLRRWIVREAALLPPTARLQEALRQVFDADSDHLPVVVWDRHALRRYRDRLFLTPVDPPRLAVSLAWDLAAEERLELGTDLGVLSRHVRLGGLARDRLPSQLTVTGRSGGEALKPAHGAATRSVQHLCQELGVLPWMRDALPYLFAGRELVAIGDLWLEARWCVARDETGVAFRWTGGPTIL